MTSTSGIHIGNHLLMAGDASGPRSAQLVLRNPVVDAAVLETARGGLLREGLAFARCDVGAVLNVAGDHLGLGGIDTVGDLARLKSVVVRSVARAGHSVLNADDPLTAAMAGHAGGRIVWFSARGGRAMPRHLARHIASGGLAIVQDGDAIAVHRDGRRMSLIAVADLPAALGGAAGFNVMNALAAAAMALAHGIAPGIVARALAGFTTSFADSPGRLNLHVAHGVRVIVDYAHNPAALAALGDLLRRLRTPGGRLIGMVSIPGDRRDDDLRAMGQLAAAIFDEIMLREPANGRGRPPGTITALMAQGARAAGKPGHLVHQLPDERAATAACLAAARPGDLVALMPTDVEAIWRQVTGWSPG